MQFFQASFQVVSNNESKFWKMIPSISHFLTFSLALLGGRSSQLSILLFLMHIVTYKISSCWKHWTHSSHCIIVYFFKILFIILCTSTYYNQSLVHKILGVIKRNPLFFHSISCKNNGFLFTTPNIFSEIIHYIIESCVLSMIFVHHITNYFILYVKLLYFTKTKFFV